MSFARDGGQGPSEGPRFADSGRRIRYSSWSAPQQYVQWRLPLQTPPTESRGPVGRLQSRDARTAGAHSASAQQRQSLISAHGLFLPGAGRPRIFAPAESPPPVSKGREGRLGSGERGSATQDLLESVAGAAVLAGRRGATPLASQE